MIDMCQAILVVLALLVGAGVLLALTAIVYFVVMSRRHEQHMTEDQDDDHFRPL